MSDAPNLKDAVQDLKDGNGCVLADKMSNMNLTDRVNFVNLMMSEYDKSNTFVKGDDSPRMTLDKGASSRRGSLDQTAHLEISAKKPSQWSSTSIYHEDYGFYYNRSTIECTDLHLNQQNGPVQSKKYTKQY